MTHHLLPQSTRPVHVGTWNGPRNAERNPTSFRNENTTLAENGTLKGKSADTENSTVLNDAPPCFVRVVTVSALKKKVLSKGMYVSKQLWYNTQCPRLRRVKRLWLHKATHQEKIARWHAGVKLQVTYGKWLYLAA